MTDSTVKDLKTSEEVAAVNLHVFAVIKDVQNYPRVLQQSFTLPESVSDYGCILIMWGWLYHAYGYTPHPSYDRFEITAVRESSLLYHEKNN